LNRGLHTPDKVIFLTVPQVDTLIQRIHQRGRNEETGIASPFLEGLNCYYQAFPTILSSKYGLDVLKLDVTNTDIRSGEGKTQFLDEVSSFLAR
jgi:deoxyadenosine/deoxycytidine kinase